MRKELKEFEEKMKVCINGLDDEFLAIRAGRANPHVLDHIQVEYYGTMTPLQQVSNVSVPEARTIMIQPWEKSLLKEIEKAILISDLGINPNNDGTCIRLNFPELTEERRKDLAKDVKAKGEDTKVSVRNIRREANDYFRSLEDEAGVSEDDIHALEEDVQKLTDKYIKLIDTMVENKTEEVMTI